MIMLTNNAAYFCSMLLSLFSFVDKLIDRDMQVFFFFRFVAREVLVFYSFLSISLVRDCHTGWNTAHQSRTSEQSSYGAGDGMRDAKKRWSTVTVTVTRG